MNFNLGFNPAAFGQQPQQNNQSEDLSSVRKNMAFDYCFKSLYPKHANQDMMRACIVQYKEYCKMTERIFTQVIRERRQRQEQAKSAVK